MRSPLTIIGICGWAIPSLWFQSQIKLAFPESHVEAFYPQNPADETEAQSFINQNSAELWIGYSLGSLWLLKYAHLLQASKKTALLCPVLGFPNEMKLGGKISVVQLNYIARNLKRKPNDKSPVFDFLKLIGVNRNDKSFKLNIEPSTLLRGLEFLQNTSIDPEILPGNVAIMGDQDPLIDNQSLRELIPDLLVVPGAGHHPAPLLQSLAASFQL